jgi:hypothetical protein
MTAAKLDIAIEQGATFLYSIDTVGPDLAGATGDMQLRAEPGAPTVLFEFSTANGGMVITPAGDVTATIVLSATAAQTALLNFVNAVYDLELTLANTDVVRLLYGNVWLSLEVTR